MAAITGKMCYNMNNSRDGIPDSARALNIRYTFGTYKEAFLQMDQFARSLKPEVIYSKTYLWFSYKELLQKFGSGHDIYSYIQISK